MRSTKALWVLPLLAVLSGLCFAQPAPLHAELDPLPDYVSGGFLRVDISSDFSVIPDSAHIQFRRVSIAPHSGYDSTSVWLPGATTHFNFDGADDSVYVAYQVRAAADGDTTDWSTPRYVLHDLNPPSPVERLEADWCATGEGHIRLTWNRAHDSASGIGHYRIYRSEGGSVYEMIFIDSGEFDLYYASLSADERSYYIYEDHGVTPGQTYHYAVVGVDEVGHWFTRTVPATQLAGGPDECIPEPPYAPLRAIDHYTEAENIEIEINTDIVTPRHSWQFQYMVQKTCPGDTLMYADTTDWTFDLTHTFDLTECCEYTFHARAKDELTGLMSGWSHLSGDRYTQRDIYGPDWGPDTMWIEYCEEGLRVNFEATDPELSDCGAGWSHYNLYRIPFEDYSIELIRDADFAEPYKLWEYDGTSGSYVYADDCPGTDPDLLDLEDRVNYFYWVISFDNLGHYSRPSDVAYDTATVDKGIKEPALAPLDAWTAGDSVVLTIIDSSFCDMTDIEIYLAYNHMFSPLERAMEYPVDTTVFTYDGVRTCDDVNRFSITYRGLVESRVCFKARGYDEIRNVSEWSNVVCTELDYTPPSIVHVDSIMTIADSTEDVNVRLTWRGARDARVGMEGYKVYRSTDPASPMETLLADLSEVARTFVDYDPDPTNNFRDNYYTIVSYDRLGYQYEGDALHTVGFFDETPPYPVTIDTVYLDVDGADISVIVDFSDDIRPTGYGSPLLNEFRLEHASTEEWLWFGDDELITIEPDHATSSPSRFVLPYSALDGVPTRYFQIATIDMEGNESGYSQIYEYARDVVEDTAWVHLTAGWNFFSLPVYPGSYRTDFVLPGVRIVEYDPVTRLYIEEPDFFEVGKGYWVFVTRDMDVPVIGVPILDISPRLTPAGWHIVGATFNTTDYTTEGTLLRAPMGYDAFTQSYYDADSIRQAQAYWILFESDTSQFMAPSTADFKYTPFQTYEPEMVVDIQLDGANYQLGMDSRATTGIDSYDRPLPPPAPNQIRRAYIASDNGMAMERDTRPVSEWTINVTEETELTWADAEITLDGMKLGDEGSILLQAGIHKISTEIEKAESFEIAGAYPNPFNAAVEIEFDIPEKGPAHIEIYDIEGKVVWETTRDYESSGRKTVNWNGKTRSGESLVSGVYFGRVSYFDNSATIRLLYVR